MSDVDILAKLVVDNPDNVVVAMMLQDELMNERDYQPTEAVRHVERIQADGRAARDLATATRVLSSDSPYRDQLRRACIVAAGAKSDVTVEIMIVPGDRYPTRRATVPHDVTNYWDESTVIVGAEWIVRRYRLLPAMKWPNRSAKTKKRKSSG